MKLTLHIELQDGSQTTEFASDADLPSDQASRLSAARTMVQRLLMAVENHIRLSEDEAQ